MDANKNKPPTRPITKPALIVSPTVNVKNSEETLTKWKKGINFKNTNFSPSGVKLVSNNKIRVEFDTKRNNARLHYVKLIIVIWKLKPNAQEYSTRW